ncbi:MAG: flippase-like domain-containing protein [Christensenellaceae bacterium]|jgi:uncharacterized protein (TIRG00374 family)|nr:flippase-like domain-containing protein [Christensenellaceae bacterium]
MLNNEDLDSVRENKESDKNIEIIHDSNKSKITTEAINTSENSNLSDGVKCKSDDDCIPIKESNDITSNKIGNYNDDADLTDDVASINLNTGHLESNEQIDPTNGNSRNKKKYRKLFSFAIFIIFNVLAIGLVLYMERINESTFVSLNVLFKVLQANVIFILLAFLFYVIGNISNAISFFALIKQCGYGNRFILALKVVLMGRYYDNITPWNTGGQPFQVNYLAKANIDFPTAVSLPIIKYTIRVFFINIVTLILFLCFPADVPTIVKVGAYGGLVITPTLPILLIIFSKKVPFMLKVTSNVVKFLYKLKIVKNYEKTVAKAQDMMDSFLAAIKYLGQHKSMILIVGVTSLIDYFAVGTIPFLILRAFGETNVDYWQCLTLGFFASMSSGIIPTPGSSGVSEGVFYSVFVSAVPAGFIFWAVLFWRIMVFYLHIIVGILVHILDWIMGKTKITLIKEHVSWLEKKTLKTGSINKKKRGVE